MSLATLFGCVAVLWVLIHPLSQIFVNKSTIKLLLSLVVSVFSTLPHSPPPFSPTPTTFEFNFSHKSQNHKVWVICLSLSSFLTMSLSAVSFWFTAAFAAAVVVDIVVSKEWNMKGIIKISVVTIWRRCHKRISNPSDLHAPTHIHTHTNTQTN